MIIERVAMVIYLNNISIRVTRLCSHRHKEGRRKEGRTLDEWMNECLKTPQHKNYIGCWVLDNGI